MFLTQIVREGVLALVDAKAALPEVATAVEAAGSGKLPREALSLLGRSFESLSETKSLVGSASKNGACLVDTISGVSGSQISVAAAVEKYLPAKISSFPSSEINRSYSNGVNIWGSELSFVSLPDPLSAQADIARLLGPRRLADVKNGFSFDSMRTVETELGKVDLTVRHRSNMSELYFHVPDTDTAGTALTFQIDKSVLPSSRLQVLDTDGIFSGLFKRAGWNGLAANVKGASEHAFHRRLTSLTEAERTRMSLNELLGDSTRHMQPAGIFVENKAGFVPQGQYGIASLENAASWMAMFSSSIFRELSRAISS